MYFPTGLFFSRSAYSRRLSLYIKHALLIISIESIVSYLLPEIRHTINQYVFCAHEKSPKFKQDLLQHCLKQRLRVNSHVTSFLIVQNWHENYEKIDHDTQSRENLNETDRQRMIKNIEVASNVIDRRISHI